MMGTGGLRYTKLCTPANEESNGKIQAYREGKVTLTASVVPTEALTGESPEPVSASCTFYVYNPVMKIRFDGYDVYEEEGEREDKLLKAGIGNIKIPSAPEDGSNKTAGAQLCVMCFNS